MKIAGGVITGTGLGPDQVKERSRAVFPAEYQIGKEFLHIEIRIAKIIIQTGCRFSDFVGFAISIVGDFSLIIKPVAVYKGLTM